MTHPRIPKRPGNQKRIAEWRFVLLLTVMLSILFLEPLVRLDRGSSLILHLLDTGLLVASVNLSSGRSRRATGCRCGPPS
jgi:hypothetical protein